ncbi:trypsin-like peptidase domain-containing protein [Acholeplasma equirhinis]|uniref:S1C family serine protease n=1 Tax=Acholeplasma equirhinis TaxID=555393 RepID=UPI00197A7F05|nr:trypsin-like peptidase domain-containing protein [Acholeplasma equirhinis]MBN3490862.1 trypsin-like peptidase domain-containing protein [Acholeplasma equirhinis]
MKKILSLFYLGCFIFLLVGCIPKPIEHPEREHPTVLQFQTLTNNLKASTVALLGHYMEFDLGLGSGSIFHREEVPGGYLYYVVTNNHVVDGVTHVKVQTAFDRIELGDIYAYPTGTSIPDHEDIAIVRFMSEFDYPMIDIIPLQEENMRIQVTKGMTVFGIGTPINEANFNLVTNLGIVSGIDSMFIGHTANINPGNSGGPLFSYDGTFIGINTQRIEKYYGETVYLMAEAIHVNQVAKMIETRLNAVTPKLGVHLVASTDFLSTNYVEWFGERAQDFIAADKIDTDYEGIVIIDINSTRPSYGQFEIYDLITHFENQPVTKNEELIGLIGEVKSGMTYHFTVRRFDQNLGQYKNVVVTVEIP